MRFGVLGFIFPDQSQPGFQNPQNPKPPISPNLSTVTPRSVKDRLGVLVKTFKHKESASLAASGIFEAVAERDILLRVC